MNKKVYVKIKQFQSIIIQPIVVVLLKSLFGIMITKYVSNALQICHILVNQHLHVWDVLQIHSGINPKNDVYKIALITRYSMQQLSDVNQI